MNGFWKGVSLMLILLIGVTAAYNLFFGVTQISDDTVGRSQKEYQKQLKVYEQQMAEYRKQQLEVRRQLSVNVQYQEHSKALLKRMETLFEKWEKQADRYDAILERWEKEVGIKTR